nr:CD0415/CD1112 family protein [uncultured Oscillibacter sp.]
MLNILDTIQEWIMGILKDCIMGNLNGMFDQINTEVGEVAANVGTTPAAWNAGVFSMIRNLSDNVVVPIAGMVLTFVMCYELISMIIDRNNLHDFETFAIYKWIIKTFVAVYLVSHTFDITMAIFEMAQTVVQRSAGIITGSTSVDFAAALGDVSAQLDAMGIGELFGLLVETMLLKITMPILSLCVMLVLIGRMIEIYIYCSVGAIPFATMTNREWGQIGQNYLRGLVALGLQGFFIMICVAIYAVLISQIGSGANLHMAIWQCAGYTVLLCFSLFKTGAVSKSILNAH